MKKKAQATLINEKITAPKLQVISETGDNLGVLSRDEALDMARAASLDLVVLNDSEATPLAKIMDFGKNLYAKKKKSSENKKKQKIVKVKEIKMRPKIGDHDYQTKVNQGIKFLNQGHRLKVTLMFRGREAIMKESKGAEMFSRFDETLQEAGLANYAHEKDTKSGPFWSRVYYLKSNK